MIPSIRDEYQDEYRRFFATFSIVCSAPLQFSWCGGVGLYLGSAGLLQKLPFRIYVGVEKGGTGIEVISCRIFQPKLRRFVDGDMRHKVHQQAWVRVEKMIKKYYGMGGGVRVGILMEYDWDDINALGLALLYTLHLLYTPDDMHVIREIGYTSVEAWSIGETPQVQILRRAWEVVMCLSQDGYVGSSGAGVICGAVHSPHPVCYRVVVDDYTPVYDRMFRVHTLGEGHIQDVPPVDMILLSPYIDCEERLVQHRAANHLPAHIQHSWTEVEGWQGMSNEKERRKSVGSMLHQRSEPVIGEWSQMLLGNMRHRLFPYLNMFHIYNTITAFDRLPGDAPNPLYTKLLMKLEQAGISREDFFLQERMISGNKKIVGLAKKGVFTSLMEGMPEYYDAVDYMSWRDGFEQKGACVEQCWEKDQYHPSLSRGHYRILTSKGVEVVSPMDPVYFAERYTILADGRCGRLYIGGVPLSSDDLKSQVGTVAVLKALLRGGGTLSSHELPKKSYTTDKDTFQKLIWSPWKRVVEKYTGVQWGAKFSTIDNGFVMHVQEIPFSCAVLEEI